MCSWDYWEDPRINNSQILRTYTRYGVSMASLSKTWILRMIGGARRRTYSLTYVSKPVRQGGRNRETYPKPVGVNPQHRLDPVGALPMCRWGGTPSVSRH